MIITVFVFTTLIVLEDAKNFTQNMEEVLKKYEKQLGLKPHELRKIISDALDEENYEERLVDIFGVENIEDVLYICTTFPKRSERSSVHFEEIELSRYQERQFETIASRDIYGKHSVPVNKVPNGEKYFNFKFFNHIQSSTFDVVYQSNENVLISAPTGSGKTEIAILGILRARASKKGKIVYVAPMKALATEITYKLERILSEKICEFTGDVEISSKEARKYDIFVSTPEKFEVVTRRQGNFFEKLLNLVIIDEIHLLQDERGAILESIVCRIFRYIECGQRQIRIIGISATLPNAEDVSRFIKARKFFKFDDSYRPVSLSISILGVYGNRKKNGRRTDEATAQNIFDVCLEKVVEHRSPENQILLFTHSRPDTVFTARKLAQEIEPRHRLKRVFENGLFNEFLSKEIGVHHAGLPRHIRHAMEKLFLDKKIKILVCTSTLAWGVNLPANVVIIKGTTYYDAQKGNFFDISILDIVQIFGRAGRPQFDKRGRAILITSKDKLNTFTKLLIDKRPIESQFLNSLVDFLNAEINLGNVENIEGGLIWIRNTFLYTRMCKNPSLYGLTNEKEGIDDVLRDYLLLSVKRLRDCRMVEIRKDTISQEHLSWRFSGTEFGRIASFYYIHHETLALWLKKLPGITNDHSILFLLFESLEFKNIIYRAEESEALKDLASELGIEFEEAVATKILVLVIAAFQKTRIYSFSLSCDQNYVIHNLKRLFQALIFILIEVQQFNLFKMALDLQIKTKNLAREDFQVDAEMHFFKAGHFLNVKIKTTNYGCCYKDSVIQVNQAQRKNTETQPMENSLKYALVSTETQISAVKVFSREADFFIPLPESKFTIEIGGIDRNWSSKRRFLLDEIRRLPYIEELYCYGIHKCPETCWTLGTGIQSCKHFKFFDKAPETEDIICIRSFEEIVEIKNTHCKVIYFSSELLSESQISLALENITDHKDDEINLKIFNLIAEMGSPVTIVVQNEADSNRTAKFLRARYALESGCFENGDNHGIEHGISLISKQIRIVTFDQSINLQETCHIIFKGCKSGTGHYPMAKMFGIISRNATTIFERKDFCDFAKRVFIG